MEDIVRLQIAPLIAPSIRRKLLKVPCKILENIEEIRIRRDRPLIVNYCGGEQFVGEEGVATKEKNAYRATADDIMRTLQLISNCSLYAFEEELRNGYITVPGGHRVGLAGQAVIENSKVKILKNISSLNFRIARQVIGAADKVISYLLDTKRRKVYHTLIVSPPQGGKTTLLRDLARVLSNGIAEHGITGFKVGIVDERSEIAGSFEGVPQLDVGIRTDVLDACPKAEGMMILLRSMSPEIIITDELGRSEDVAAIEEVCNGGITVISSVHGSSLVELQRRPTLKKLLELKIFERFVFLGNSKGLGTIEMIADQKGEALYPSS